MRKDEQIKQFKTENDSDDAMQNMESIGFEINRDHRPCLQYNLKVIGNANLMINEMEWNSEQHHDPYGYLLQFRLEKFVLMMENNECRYQLMRNMKSIANVKKYKFIQISLGNGSKKQQRNQNKISDDLSWEDLKWSNRGIKIGYKLYPILKVWLVNRARIG